MSIPFYFPKGSELLSAVIEQVTADLNMRVDKATQVKYPYNRIMDAIRDEMHKAGLQLDVLPTFVFNAYPQAQKQHHLFEKKFTNALLGTLLNSSGLEQVPAWSLNQPDACD